MKRNFFQKLIACSVLIFTLTYPFTGSAQSISINAATLKQKVDAIGGDIERSQAFIPKAANGSEVMQWCFGDINLNVCRVSYDKKQELTEGVKNMAFYAGAIQSMKWIKQVNPNIKFLATMKSDYDGFNEENHNNLPTFIYDYACTAENASGNCSQSTGTKSFNANKFGIFLADYLQHMHTNGVTISYLSTAKEWQSVVTPQRSHDVYLKMKSECQLRGVPVPQLIGPASWGLPAAITFVNETKTLGYTSDFYAFSSHNLGDDDDQYDDFANAATAAGKPAWDDESSTGSNGRTSGAEIDIATTINAYREKTLHYAAGFTGEVMFELTSRGVNAETRSVYFQNGQTGTRMRGYYILKEFANNVLNKNYVASTIASLPGVYTMAFRSGNNLVTIVLNESDTPYTSVPFTLSGVNITSSISQQKWTNSTAIMGSSSSFTRANNSSFTRTIEGKSIHIFTCSVENASTSLFLNNIGNNLRMRYTDQGATPATAYVEGTGATATGNWVQWQFIDAGSGWSYIKNLGSNRYLQCTATTIDGGVDGAVQVYLVPMTNTGTNVQWKKVDAGNGRFYLLNRAHTKYLQCTDAPLATTGQHIRGINTNKTGTWTQWTETAVSAGARQSISFNTLPMKASFVVYPNPSRKEMLTLELAGEESQNRIVTITDLAGHQVITHSVTSPTCHLNISHLASGVYMITVQQDKTVQTQRLVID